MEAATQDMSAVIADEIAEHNKLKPSPRISPEVQKARFEGLVQLVKTVLAALEQAEMGNLQPANRSNKNLEEWCAFLATPHADRRLVIQIDTDHINLSWETTRWAQSSPLRVSPDLFWDPLHRRWVGPRLARDHRRVDAPWVRESAEATVARAILNAYEHVRPSGS